MTKYNIQKLNLLTKTDIGKTACINPCLRIAYYSLFQSHLQYGVQRWKQKNQEIKEIMHTLYNCAFRKINF